jgi:hypothetical protein
VIVASDAEAAIIAHTSVRMIVDCLAVEPTKFPHSMYLVGFEAAGRPEIGGLLMAEDLGGNTFRLREITIQKHGGSFATFVRSVQDCVGPLQRFFRTTQHNYRKI